MSEPLRVKWTARKDEWGKLSLRGDSVPLTHERVREIAAWCAVHMTRPYMLHVVSYAFFAGAYSRGHAVFRFESEDDRFHFKMRWK
jgi:hypothetical protein